MHLIPSVIRRILAGLVLLPLAVGAGVLAFGQVFRAADVAAAWYLLLLGAAVAVPVAGVFLLGGTVDGVRVLRQVGWRAHPLAGAVVALGALATVVTLFVLLTLPTRCLGG